MYHSPASEPLRGPIPLRKPTLLILAFEVLHLPTPLSFFCGTVLSLACSGHMANVFALKSGALGVPSAQRAGPPYPHKIVSFLTFQFQPKRHLLREDFPVAFLPVITFTISEAFTSL